MLERDPGDRCVGCLNEHLDTPAPLVPVFTSALLLSSNSFPKYYNIEAVLIFGEDLESNEI